LISSVKWTDVCLSVLEGCTYKAGEIRGDTTTFSEGAAATIIFFAWVRHRRKKIDTNKRLSGERKTKN
jgi:hypothetical protein